MCIVSVFAAWLTSNDAVQWAPYICTVSVLAAWLTSNDAVQ